MPPNLRHSPIPPKNHPNAKREKIYRKKKTKKQCRQTYDTAQYHLKTTPIEGTTHPNPPKGRELDMLLLIDLWFIRKSVGCFLFYFSVNNRLK